MGFVDVKSGAQIMYERARSELHSAGKALDDVRKSHAAGMAPSGALGRAQDRYKGATQGVKEANAVLQTGRRGGQFSLSKTGKKVYQHKA